MAASQPAAAICAIAIAGEAGFASDALPAFFTCRALYGDTQRLRAVANARGASRRTLLMHAAVSGNLPRLRALLAAGADANLRARGHSEYNRGQPDTALQFAALGRHSDYDDYDGVRLAGRVECAAELIAAGADISADSGGDLSSGSVEFLAKLASHAHLRSRADALEQIADRLATLSAVGWGRAGIDALLLMAAMEVTRGSGALAGAVAHALSWYAARNCHACIEARVPSALLSIAALPVVRESAESMAGVAVALRALAADETGAAACRAAGAQALLAGLRDDEGHARRALELMALPRALPQPVTLFCAFEPGCSPTWAFSRARLSCLFTPPALSRARSQDPDGQDHLPRRRPQ